MGPIVESLSKDDIGWVGGLPGMVYLLNLEQELCSMPGLASPSCKM